MFYIPPLIISLYNSLKRSFDVLFDWIPNWKKHIGKNEVMIEKPSNRGQFMTNCNGWIILFFKMIQNLEVGHEIITLRSVIFIHLDDHTTRTSCKDACYPQHPSTWERLSKITTPPSSFVCKPTCNPKFAHIIDLMAGSNNEVQSLHDVHAWREIRNLWHGVNSEKSKVSATSANNISADISMNDHQLEAITAFKHSH